ncbi:hypothetical protein ACGFK1_31675 [Mycobacterium sp. NPDC048908]|uniref:hypothetical protein n=1 Tax=Mycobacterium sp. NPDC048908 TaxID=3364292 RepID=UPI003722F6AD
MLAGVAPDAVATARPALARILEPLRASQWPQVAWRFSRLTASGNPVEFSFSTADPALRYTAEVAGPEVDTRSRLPRALTLLAELSAGATIPPALADELAALQQAGQPQWGAWIGGRHDGTRSRYKLYADVPPGIDTTTFLVNQLGCPHLLAHRRSRLEGVGHEIQTGLTELYFRLDGLDVADTGVLLHRSGLGERQRDLLAVMETVYRRTMRPHLPSHPFGVSVATTPGYGAVAISVFAYAIDVFGDDAATRAALLRVGSQLNWDATAYRVLSAPLADVHSAPTHHSVVAFTVAGDAPAALTVGMAPPWP